MNSCQLRAGRSKISKPYSWYSIQYSVAPMSRYNICICRYHCIGTISVSVETISVLPIRANTDARGRSRINVRQLQIAVGAVTCTRTLNNVEKKIAYMEVLHRWRQRSPGNLQYLQRLRPKRRSVNQVLHYDESSWASPQASYGV